MLRTILKKIGSGLLALTLLCTAAIPQGYSYGATIPSDIKGHWAESYITKAINAGIISGYPNGGFKPDNPVSRAEFIHMLNAVLGNTGTTAISYSDTPRSEWYYTDISKAVAAGYVSGYSDSTFKPNDTITRQEAAVMLARIIPTYGKSKSLSMFSDASSVPNWAAESLRRIYGKGYMGAYDDAKLHPEAKMTRAQAAKIVCDIADKETIVKTDPNVTLSGTTLSDKIYSNGVTISKSLNDGNATISNCIVFGTLNIQGGGENSVSILNSRVTNSTVAKSSGRVRVYVRGESDIKNMTASNEVTLQTSSLNGGDFGGGLRKIDVVRNANVIFTGNFQEINLTGAQAETTFTAGTVETLNIAEAATESDVTVETSATVTTSTVGGKGTKFHGNGTIHTMNVNADNVSYAKKPNRVNVGKNVSTDPDETESTNGDITVSPASGADDVSVDTEIKLTFKRAMTLYNGDAITSSNIDDFIELRRSSSNGRLVDFEASINSAKKIITITPEENLDDDTKYYIIIDKKELKDSNGDPNDGFRSYFTTGDKDSSSTIGNITISPANRKTGVRTDTDITLKFKYAMTLYNGKTITSSNIDDFVQLRRASSSGTSVDFDARIDSNKKVITITPNKDLKDDTRYYVIIDKHELKDSRGDGNSSFSAYFTTGDDESSNYVTFSPKKGTSEVSVNAEPTIKFSEKMLTYSGNTLTSSRLSDIIVFRKESATGSRVPFDVSLNSAKTTITITPRSRLSENTKYYLGIDEKSLKTEKDGTVIPKTYVTWSTVGNSTPKITALSGGSSADTTAYATATGNLSGTIYAVIVPSSQSTPSADQVYNGKNASNVTVSRLVAAASGGSSKNLGTFTGLSAGTSYKICAILRIGSTNSSVMTTTINTTSNNSPIIKTLTASSTDDATVHATITGNMAGTVYAVILPSGDSAPSAAQIVAGKDGNNSSVGSRAASGSVTANGGRQLAFSGLSGSTNYRVYAVLNASSKNSSIYSASVTTKAPTVPDAQLTSLTVNGNSMSIGSSTSITAEVAYAEDISSITVVAKGELVKFDSDNFSDNSATKDLPISGSSATTTITVGGNGKKNKTYTLTVRIKGGSTKADLFVAGEPIKDGGIYEAGNVDSIAVRVEPKDSAADVSINGGSGKKDAVLLEESSTKITVKVSNNGSSSTYTFTVIRTPDSSEDAPDNSEDGGTDTGE